MRIKAIFINTHSYNTKAYSESLPCYDAKKESGPEADLLYNDAAGLEPPETKRLIIDFDSRMRHLNVKLEKIRRAGLTEPQPSLPVEEMDDLTTRIEKMLHLLRTAPKKATTMTFLVLYDIESDKVRKLVAKYLKQQGCIRIQKSVFLASQPHVQYQKILEDLKEVQSYYDNADSIILVPINTEDARSMKLIGKDVQIETIIDKPNTLFF